MFTIGEKNYELKFNLARVKNIEKALGGESVTHAMLNNDGMMSVTAVLTMFAYGLIEVGTDAVVLPNIGQALGEQYMAEAGYAAAVRAIQEAVKRDLGFLFRLA